MVDNRQSVIGGIWAENAANVPGSPVGGITYADENLTEEEIQAGWPYSENVDSSMQNEVMRRVTTLLLLLEKYGTLPWCPYTSYDTSSRTLGSDGYIYRSVQDDNLNKDPTSNSPLWWVNDSVDSHASETSAHSATALATPSRIVVRDASGDFSANLVRSEATLTSSTCKYFVGQNELGGSTKDNYHRPMSLSQARNVLLGFTSLSYLKEYTGYFPLPGGFIFQFGQTSFGSNETTTNTIVLPTTFPTKCLITFASRSDYNKTLDNEVGSYHYSRSSIQVWSRSGPDVANWFAIGY